MTTKNIEPSALESHGGGKEIIIFLGRKKDEEK